MAKPRVGIFGLTGCAGDQLAIINCEDELLDIIGALDIRSFVMAISGPDDREFDVSFVEGSVSTEEDEALLKEVREKSGLLIALGTCASWGGIPGSASENTPLTELYRAVYKSDDNLYGSRKAVPLKEIVKVDFSISGCPVEKDQITSGIASLLHGDVPLLPAYAVCFECRMKENLCLLKEKGQLCMGPLTVGGCKARCPSHGVPCRGCRGPVDEANVASEYQLMQEKGFTAADVERAMRTFARDHVADLAAAGGEGGRTR